MPKLTAPYLRLALSALLITMLIFAGQMTATARGLAAQGGPWATLCLGAVTVQIKTPDGTEIQVACPDGILAIAALPPPPAPPLRIVLDQPAEVLAYAATTAPALQTQTPLARGPPALT